MLLSKVVQGLLRDDEVARAVDAVPVVKGELGFDPWGFSPLESKGFFSIGHQIYRYFRPLIYGIENIPKGRVLIVANHSGQFPFDGLVISMATLLRAHPPRLMRVMAERWVSSLPYISEMFARSGVVLGDPINCRNLLEADNAILVFPEGAAGSGKTWDHRYRLVRFGRGFMRLALQTGAPIVPVAVIGAEESIPSVHNWKWLARKLHFPYFPIPALLPVLGPLSFAPLPTRFHVYFGEPMTFDGPFDDEDEAIDQKVDVVMNKVQSMIDEGLARRKSVFA